MNQLTKVLLGSAALCALAAVPSVAAKPAAMHVMALHAGKAVNKTRVHAPCTGRACITYTFAAYTSVPSSDLGKRVSLVATYYKWNNSYSCSTGDVPKQKIKAPKKSIYGKVRTATESYSLGCVYGPTVFYGDTYKLVDSSGFGKTDTFVSILYGKFEIGHTKYKGTLYLDVSVAIGN